MSEEATSRPYQAQLIPFSSPFSYAQFYSPYRSNTPADHMNALPEITCSSGAEPHRFSADQNTTDYIYMENDDNTTSVHALNICDAKDPFQVWVQHKHSTFTDWKHYEFAKVHAAFTERDNGSSGTHSIEAAGISQDGTTIAFSLIQNNERGDYSVIAFQVIVIRQGQVYHLPIQHTVNTRWLTPDATLSPDGRHIAINTGAAIQLFEYQPQADAYNQVGRQSIATTHPIPHKQHSLYFTRTGLNVVFDTLKA